MKTRGYDPAQVILTVDGNDITGFADGSFVEVTRNVDAFELSVGADGESTRAKSNDRSGKFKFVLQQSSPSNDVLSAIANADEESNQGVVGIQVKDAGGTSLHSGEKCWNVKKADATYAKTTENREWLFETGNLEHFVGGNADL